MTNKNLNMALALTVCILGAGNVLAQDIDLSKVASATQTCTSGDCSMWQHNNTLQSCTDCSSLSSAESKHMNQVYSYPFAIYGTNNIVGENNRNSVRTGSGIDDNMGRLTNATSKGVPLAATQSDNMTGAAANMPVIGNYYDFIDTDNNASPKINIQTQNTQQAIKRSLKPLYLDTMTGAASPIASTFPDVPDGYWANHEINKLAQENIIAGYPNKTFRPNLPVTRAEFASFIVRGMNMEDAIYNSPNYNFKDVPSSHWAYNIINAAKANDLMAGYPDNTFRPDSAVTKIEAMTMLSKKIDTNMTEKQANEILSRYSDGNKVPNWARINVAKVIDANALEDMQNPDKIFVNSNASRAEVASMLDNIRVSLGYSKDNESVASATEQKYVASDEIVNVPVLKLLFRDIVSSHSATVGEQFAATTLEDVTIDGITFKAGSTVRGKVSEVVRPSKDNDGAIKLSFETIQGGGHKANLPTQILSAQVNQMQQPNFGVRMVQMPFTWVGGLIGNAGRMVGGAAISVSNAAEQTLNGIGMSGGELLSGNFKASGRSLQDVGKTIVKAPIDMTRTALAGTLGVFQTTGSELAYLVDWNGKKISTIKPKQEVTISFACAK